jgi:hypothetical protein
MANLRKHNAIANAIVLQYAQRMNWLLYGGIAAALGYLVFFRKEESPPIPSQPGQAGIAVGSCVAVDLTRVADNPVDLVDLITLITNNGTTTIRRFCPRAAHCTPAIATTCVGRPATRNAPNHNAAR